MSKPASQPSTELRIRASAADWARQKLAAEDAERTQEDEIRQISLRIPAEDAAFAGALAKRFGMSRNQFLCMMIGTGGADVYATLPEGERKRILAAVEEDLGRKVQPRWLRKTPIEDSLADAVEEGYLTKAEADQKARMARFEP